MKEEIGNRTEYNEPACLKCPHCGEPGDYWRTALHLRRGEESTVPCLSCKKQINIRGIELGFIGLR